MSFHIIAGARDIADKGQIKVREYLNTRLRCDAPDIEVPIQPGIECERMLDEFKSSWEYVQLKSEDHYKDLNKILMDAAKDKTEAGRLFYMSVPPFAYEDIARNIKSHCKAPGDAWTRVVLEKPFGK